MDVEEPSWNPIAVGSDHSKLNDEPAFGVICSPPRDFKESSPEKVVLSTLHTKPRDAVVVKAIPLTAPITAEDTPSRHPFKIRTEKLRFRFHPYNPTMRSSLERSRSSDEEEEDSVAAAADALAASILRRTPPPVLTTMPELTTTMPQQATIISSPPATTPGAHFSVTPEGSYKLTPGTIVCAQVRFKHAHGVYFVPPAERTTISVGDMVVVEGDRGENVGTILSDISASYSTGNPSGLILRRALNKDRKKFYQARRKEINAVQAAQRHVETLNISMQILDIEFQTDLQKMTIFYRTNLGGSVDFRLLQRDLFKHFRCRIWLVNWDTELSKVITTTTATPLLISSSEKNHLAPFPSYIEMDSRPQLPPPPVFPSYFEINSRPQLPNAGPVVFQVILPPPAI